jgi:hypothetical protein
MPSDVRFPAKETSEAPAIEPPSVKLIVRLFLIPLIIVGVAVGIMFLIGLMAGQTPSFEEALARLKNPGGQRTADWLIGPGSKQRYLDAKALVDQMKKPEGMSETDRIKIADDLIDLVSNYTKADEGEVQHFMLLALGRAWQKAPNQPAMDSPQAVASREQTLATLMAFAKKPELPTRKAAILAMAYLAGWEQAPRAFPLLLEKLRDQKEDLDVRLAAATVLGPLAKSSDTQVTEALRTAMRDTVPENAEMVWASALSLAQLNQPDAADTILKLLDRKELAGLRYFDRETDPQHPVFRTLSEDEQLRILINTMIGAKNLQLPQVQQKLADLAKNDPSPRVRAAGMQVLGENPKGQGPMTNE